MNYNDIYKVGTWLRFRAGTCFGAEKDHLGLLVGSSEELAVCIAVYATSNVDGAKRFASRRHISPEDTVVTVAAYSPESSFHFGRETAFDCNRPSIVSLREFSEWVEDQMIEIVEQNSKVSDELLWKIKYGIKSSPMVAKKYKDIIE